MSADVLATIDERLRAQLDAPARRLLEVTDDDTTGTLAPPLYGGRHVNQDLVEGDPGWLAQLNTSIANRIAAGLGAEYVRVNQENLMARPGSRWARSARPTGSVRWSSSPGEVARHDARPTRGVDGAGRVACVRGSRECADPARR